MDFATIGEDGANPETAEAPKARAARVRRGAIVSLIISNYCRKTREKLELQ